MQIRWQWRFKGDICWCGGREGTLGLKMVAAILQQNSISEPESSCKRQRRRYPSWNDAFWPTAKAWQREHRLLLLFSLVQNVPFVSFQDLESCLKCHTSRSSCCVNMEVHSAAEGGTPPHPHLTHLLIYGTKRSPSTPGSPLLLYLPAATYDTQDADWWCPQVPHGEHTSPSPAVVANYYLWVWWPFLTTFLPSPVTRAQGGYKSSRRCCSNRRLLWTTNASATGWKKEELNNQLLFKGKSKRYGAEVWSNIPADHQSAESTAWWRHVCTKTLGE